MSEADIKGALFADIAGPAPYFEGDRVQTAFNSALTAGLEDAERHLVIGQSGWMVFSSVSICFEVAKSIASAWVDAQASDERPVYAGLRLSIHVGKLGDESFDAGRFFHVGDSLRRDAPINAIVFSIDAYIALESEIALDRLNPVEQVFRPPIGEPIVGYTVQFEELLRSRGNVSHVSVPTDQILQLALYPHNLFTLHPRTFEEVIAELLIDIGYRIELTIPTRDKGRDIIAIVKNTPLGLIQRYLVECKRYSPNRKVTLGAIDRLIGAGESDPHTGLMIVTTSQFTGPARDKAKHPALTWKLHLKDYDDICNWLRIYSARRMKRPRMHSTLTPSGS